MNLLRAERVSSLLQPKVHQGSNKFLMDSSKTLWSSRKEVSALQPGRKCLAQYHTDLDPPALKPQTRLPVCLVPIWQRRGTLAACLYCFKVSLPFCNSQLTAHLFHQPLRGWWEISPICTPNIAHKTLSFCSSSLSDTSDSRCPHW